jgi:hypothetical protein
MVQSDLTVCVRRHPSDWQTAVYRFSDIDGLHWSNVAGGVGRRTSHDALFGYVMCDGSAVKWHIRVVTDPVLIRRRLRATPGHAAGSAGALIGSPAAENDALTVKPPAWRMS